MKLKLFIATLSLGTALSAHADLKVAYKSDPARKKLVDEFIKYKGSDDSLEDYAKVVVPTYQIAVKTFEQVVESHGLLARAIGNKSALTMTVTLDPKPLEAAMKEVTEESQARFKKKLEAFGYKVEDEVALSTTQEDVKEWFKDDLKPSPQVEDKKFFVGSKGVYEGTFAAGCDFTRDIDAGCQIPRFVISLGSFVDKAGPGVIAAKHEGVEIFFKPEVKVEEANIILNGEYVSSWVALKKPMVSSLAMATETEKTGDNSDQARHLAEASLNANRIFGNTDNFLAFSAAGKSFEMKPNPADFKTAVMSELDKFEDLLLEAYYQELN